MTRSFFENVYNCLLITDPAEKVSTTYQCFDDYHSGKLVISNTEPAKTIPVPGRPDRPILVDARKVPKRTMNSVKGRVVLAHAIAHIEFNAINLALDAAYRFRHMPAPFYADWLKVAKEEAEHFSLINDYLKNHDHQYGDFEAHNGLWEMALKTDSSVLERMALVPRVLEARGLDVTPGMIDKLTAAGDIELVECLKIIHKEEIGHVAIGSHWFKYSCEEQGVEPRQTFLNLLKQEHVKNAVRGPYDEWSRIQAGFTEDEIQDLKSLEVSRNKR